MTKPWAMARVASRRQLPKPRKMMGPVGERPAPNGELHAAWDADDKPFAIACKACGHDRCDCRSDAPEPKPLNLANTFDDHARHVANHVQTAERLGICGLCHSHDHKFMQCPDRARLYRESLEFYK